MKKKPLLLLLLFFLLCVPAKAQFYSISSNLIGDATLNLNAEFSMTLNRKWSLHLPLMYNPFIYKKDVTENKKFQNLTFIPGVRYWFKESYNSNFMGVHALVSRYHVSNIFDKYRYDGNAFGIGLSYGQVYPLSRKWNIEWEIGGSLLYVDYDKYMCKKCGLYIEEGKGLRLFPTKISLSAVYLF